MGLPLIYPKVQFFDINGDPLVGGKLLTKVVGGGADKITYSDAALTTPNTNPIILDSRGEASVFAGSGEIFWLRLTDANDVTIWTKDEVAIPLGSIADGSITTAKLATGAVTTAKLGDLSVTLAKIATELVNSHTDVTMVTADDRVFITDASDSNKNKKALLPAATEALKGIAQIATAAQVLAGTDDLAFVTPLKLATAVSGTRSTSPTTSGTSVTFTGIPASATRITILFDAVSSNSNGVAFLQIGDAGGIEASGYAGRIMGLNGELFHEVAFSTAFAIEIAGDASRARYGSVVLEHIGSNAWVATISVAGVGGAAQCVSGAGSKTLTDTLTQVKFAIGSDTLDGGNITAFWE